MSVQRARTLRKRMTRAEARVWTHLRPLRSQGYHFRRQAPFGGYILDFVCFSRRLVVEVDGDSHGCDHVLKRDARRDAVLAARGLRTVRISNADVLENITGVMEFIFAALETPPDPSLRSGPPSP